MIVTDDERTACLCRQLRNQGRATGNGWLEHEMVGYNYRLSECQCALGHSQLERIDEILAKRTRVATFTRACWIRSLSRQYSRLKENEAGSSTSSSFPRRFRQPQGPLMAQLRERRIGCSNYFPPIHLQPFYKKSFGYREGDFPITESVSRRTSPCLSTTT